MLQNWHLSVLFYLPIVQFFHLFLRHNESGQDKCDTLYKSNYFGSGEDPFNYNLVV